ncbi:MAG TPA: alpha-L-rhamnosidase C-terminal domain-containing protein [Bryobacteraceae bacterium]|nr:alpha-L-rhamnosidase C-terminal domain-containing protein [Bryobacteraceae bacterium]
MTRAGTLAGVGLLLAAAGAASEAIPRPWSARWIFPAGAPPSEYGVYHFRRTLELPARPGSFVVHVSGDNRYQLFVNGERVLWGPARGDVAHWRFETLDIASHLHQGRNVLAAVVWNFGLEAPMAQTSYRTAFLLHGESAEARAADTNRQWKSIRNTSYRPLPLYSPMGYYYVAGPGDEVDGTLYPWGWEQPGFDDSKWPAAVEDYEAALRGVEDSPSRWMLTPRPIPLMEERPERFSRVRQATGIAVPPGFPAGPAAMKIPTHAKARLLVDQNWLTTAYPELIVSGGGGATVRLGSAESLFRPQSRDTGNRDEVEGKVFFGNRDVFHPDGGSHRLFRPLWWRTYRYVEVTVETAGEPLAIEDLRGVYTGYPFLRRARFDADSPELTRILDTGWRTARLCAHETYMDCPYYEQLQYGGDTRIQGLVSLYMSGDGRLLRNAIEQLNASRTDEGLTLGCAPSGHPQYIPPFSLWWIGMVHDYWMYQDDPAFVKRMLPGVRAVLSYFASHRKPDGSLARMPWWNFVDWVSRWRNGVAPSGEEGSSAPLDLQLLLAYGWATEMETELGSQALAREYADAAAGLRKTILALYGKSGELFADTPERTAFSQHTNALAILAGLVEGAEAKRLLERTLEDHTLAPSSIYFKHYLHAAANKAGEGDRYLDLLEPWRAMLARGLTTWAERDEPSRSDCHAWGSSPNFELFRTVLGIDSAAPGFRRVVIRPFPGRLGKVSGAIPHPRGEIAVSLERQGDTLRARVNLPPGTTGEFVWQGETTPLTAGANELRRTGGTGGPK